MCFRIGKQIWGGSLILSLESGEFHLLPACLVLTVAGILATERVVTMCNDLTRVFYCPICKGRKSIDKVLIRCGSMKSYHSGSSSRFGCRGLMSERENVLDSHRCKNCRAHRELDHRRYVGMSRNELEMLELARWR